MQLKNCSSSWSRGPDGACVRPSTAGRSHMAVPLVVRSAAAPLSNRAALTSSRSLLAMAAAPAAAPESGTPTSSTPHLASPDVTITTTTTTTDPQQQQQQQQQHGLQKGAFVRGTVEAVDGTGATIRLAGSSSHAARLAWSKLSKQRSLKPQDNSLSLPSPGEAIWAIVADAAGTTVKLSTAGLELRPGDMLTDRQAVFAMLDSWAAEGGAESFYEWRGRQELQRFLSASKPSAAPARPSSAADADAATATQPADAPAAGGKRSSSLLARHRDPKVWGLVTEPQPAKGDLVSAVITSVKSYGAFVELDRTHDGLIPASQVSKAFVSESDIGELLRPGARVMAAVHRLEPRRKASETTAGSGSSSSGAAAGPGAGPGLLSSPDYVAIGDQQFVLSMKTLEATEGLLRSSGLEEYNKQAVQTHEQLQEQSLQQSLDDAADSLANFRDGVQEWEQGCFKLAPRTIVRGVVTGLHARGAFVRLEFGPTAFLHEDAVSHAKFKRLGDVLQVGSTVYGKLYDRPTNSSDPAAAPVAGSYWISVKDLEGKSPGQLIRNADGFWKSVEGRYKQQLTQPKKSPEAETVTMHRCDLNMRPLIHAARELEGIPWHALAGRPNPGLLMARGSSGKRQAAGAPAAAVAAGAAAGAEAAVTGAVPPPAEWSGRYAELAEEYGGAVRRAVGEAVRVLPGGFAALLSGGEAAGDAGAEAAALELATPIAPSLRHTWWSLRSTEKAVVAKLSLLQLRVAAIEYVKAVRSQQGSGDSATDSPSPSSASSPAASSSSSSASASSAGQPSAAQAAKAARAGLVLAAARAVYIARLARKPDGASLVKEVYGLLQTLKVPVHKAITDSLLLWGGALIEDAVDLGANQVRDSGLLEMLAAEGVKPAHEWCEAAFRRLYKCMVVDAPPREVTKYLRLMHALGYCPAGMAWWDRLLQQLFSNNSKAAPAEKLLPRQTQELREVVAAVVVLGKGAAAPSH